MKAKEFYKIIEQGVEVWNKWMEENPNEPVDLSLSSFKDTNLSRIDLSETCLDQTNFKNCIFRNAQFSYADLTEAILSGADLRGSDLTGAKLRGARLNNTNFRKANLSDADLSPYFVNVSMEFEDKVLGYNTEFCGTDLNGANLAGANLSKADLTKADLKNANLHGANLNEADLREIDLRGAKLSEASLINANLTGANLGGVDLRKANLTGANLNKTNLESARLDNANLSGAYLCETDFIEASLSGCRIYGISAWGVELERAIQSNLIITDYGEAEITVDNLEVAQFIYLLLNNHKIRDVINTITSKVILILGRFNDERKPILNALRDELRKHNYSPVVFDFEKPGSRNLTETVSTLAHLSRFIIADLTDAKSIPQELERIIPRLRVPVQSLLHVSEKYAYAMYRDFEDYHWVLPIYHYDDQNALLRSLQTHIIDPAEQKAQELEKRK